jgi:hypothetical protein
MAHDYNRLLVCRFLLLLVYGEKSRNTSKSDAPLWRPRPSIAYEPIVPTPTMMRTHGTRRTGWRRNILGGFSQCQHLDVLSTPMGSPDATKRLTCSIHESRIGPSMTGFRSTEAGGGKRRRTALTRRARSPLAADAKHCSRRAQC